MFNSTQKDENSSTAKDWLLVCSFHSAPALERRVCFAESNFASSLWRNLLGRYNEQVACTEDLDSTEGLQDLKLNLVCTAASFSLLLQGTGTLLRETEYCLQLGASPQQIFRGNGKTAGSVWISPVLDETRNSQQVFRLTPSLKEWIFLAMTKLAWDRLVNKIAIIINRSFNELLAQPKF